MQGELFNVRYCAHKEQKIAAGVSWVSSSVLSACLPACSNFSCGAVSSIVMTAIFTLH